MQKSTPRIRLLPFVFALSLAIADFNPVLAVPFEPQGSSAAPASDIILVRAGRGGGRGGYAGHGGMRGGRGGYGYHGGPGVAHRGYGFAGGGMYRGAGGRYYGGRGRYAGVGRYRVGGRYYGGTWYGTGRRYWRGRWWAYGVGSCWRASPIGYVWICG